MAVTDGHQRVWVRGDMTEVERVFPDRTPGNAAIGESFLELKARRHQALIAD